MLRKRIGDGVPSGLAAHENVSLRHHTRVVVQCAERNREVGGVAVEAGEDGGATGAAEALVLAGRGFVVANGFGARCQLELCGAHPRSALEGRTVVLAAHRAVAVENVEERAADAKAHAAAEAATAYVHDAIPFSGAGS